MTKVMRIVQSAKCARTTKRQSGPLLSGYNQLPLWSGVLPTPPKKMFTIEYIHIFIGKNISFYKEIFIFYLWKKGVFIWRNIDIFWETFIWWKNCVLRGGLFLRKNILMASYFEGKKYFWSFLWGNSYIKFRLKPFGCFVFWRFLVLSRMWFFFCRKYL